MKNFEKIRNLPKMQKIYWMILQIILDGNIIFKELLVRKNLKFKVQYFLIY